MKTSRTIVAVLAIAVLIAAVLVSGSAPHFAVLIVAFLLLPTLTLTRLSASESLGHPDAPGRALVLLRGPPASSIQR